MLEQIFFILKQGFTSNFIIFLVLLLPILLAVAYLTLIERKLLAILQLRRGPNVVFFFGLLQPIADAVKLFVKEGLLPRRADKYIYLIAPVFFLVLAITNWAFISFIIIYLNVEYTAIYILMISSLSVYGILLAGWSSGSMYGFFGAIRSAGQLISYELTFSLIILIIVITTKNINLYFINEFHIQKMHWCGSDLESNNIEDLLIKIMAHWSAILNLFLPVATIFFIPLGLIFFISCLAELCRPPFDLPEAEAELVSGYNVDYSSFTFAFYFIGEYSNIILISAFFVLLFWPVQIYIEHNNFAIDLLLSPYSSNILETKKTLIFFLCIFAIKILSLITLIIYVRGIVPRYRYDQLMKLQWTAILPFVLAYLILSMIIIFVPLDLIIEINSEHIYINFSVYVWGENHGFDLLISTTGFGLFFYTFLGILKNTAYFIFFDIFWDHLLLLGFFFGNGPGDIHTLWDSDLAHNPNWFLYYIK